MSIDAKSKEATMAHMNKDHSLDLGLYLRFVNGMSAEQLAAEGLPQMVDMDLSSMAIRTATSGTVHTVALDPPLASWDERRPRLVELAIEARKAFGVPLPEHGAKEKTEKTVALANVSGIDVGVIFGVALFAGLAVLVSTGHDAAPARLWATTLAKLGLTSDNSSLGGVDGFRRLIVRMTPAVLAIHVVEAWWMDRTRLAPHGITRFSRNWCQWTVFTFWGGVMGFHRFDQSVREADGKYS